MRFLRTNSIGINSWLIFIFLFITEVIFAQSQNLAMRLVTELDSSNTTEVAALLKGLRETSFLILTHYTGPELATLQLEVKEVNQSSQTYIDNLPCINLLSDLAADAKIHFKVFIDQIQKYDYTFNLRDHCQIGVLTYFVWDNDFNLEIMTISLLHGSPDSIKIVPDRRFFNYRVLSSGIISLGSGIWFLSERSKAINDYKKYTNSKYLADVVNYRISTEKHRVSRNIAGTITAVAGVTCVYFVLKDLFFPPRPAIINTYPLHTGLRERLRFGWSPDTDTDTMQLTMYINF